MRSISFESLKRVLEFYNACMNHAQHHEDHEFKAQCLIQLGELVRGVDRLQDSENTLRDALEICYVKLDPVSLEKARCYEGKFKRFGFKAMSMFKGIGLSCMALKKYSEAIESFGKAVELFKTVAGEGSIEMARSSLAYGRALGWKKNYEAAYSYCMTALKIRKEIYGPDHIWVARAMADIGEQLKCLHREREAEQIYRLQHILCFGF